MSMGEAVTIVMQHGKFSQFILLLEESVSVEAALVRRSHHPFTAVHNVILFVLVPLLLF